MITANGKDPILLVGNFGNGHINAFNSVTGTFLGELKDPDGEPIQGSYLDGRPMCRGFEENVEFFRIDYLDADDIDLGNQFDAILPPFAESSGVSCQGG